jgi:hypothetical protein
MCHNLGSDESKDPFTFNSAIAGDIYQWGRYTDGHEKRASERTMIVATSSTPNHEYFILDGATFDWTSAANKNALWGDGYIEPQNTDSAPFTQKKGPNDPCPAGWKVPSGKQWTSIFLGSTGGVSGDGGGSITTTPAANVVTGASNPAMTQAGNSGFNFGPLLYLPFGGQRGTLGPVYAGVGGNYHSSTLRLNGSDVYVNIFSISDPNLGNVALTSGAAVGTKNQSVGKNYGGLVRCVIDK